MDDWDLEVGSELTRDQRRQRYGGSLYGGIEPSASTPNVFIYTDPSVGETHGYNYDGWVEEDTIFQYTGEGRIGTQLMRMGNQAILNHQLDGRALRVFAANGIVAGTKKTKRQLYIGEFELDSHLSHFVADAPDDNEDPRSVFVFRLRPVGETFVRAEERCPNTSPPTSTRVEEAEVETWSEETEVEQSHVTSFERKPIESVTSLRREAELVGRYKKHLESQGHVIKSRKIYPAGAIQPLRVDLFDTTTEELCEAKGSTTRVQVRYAVGQLLDYSRHVDHKTLSVLLPTRPAEDLLGLLTGLGIVCVYETKKNLFKRIEPRDPTLDRIPPSDCSFEALIKFASTYDGYSQIAQEPENLVALYEPIRTEWRRSGSLPSWMGVDLLRGLLFMMYREDRWTGGFPYSSEEEKIEHQRPFREVLEAIREKFDV